MDKKKEKSEAVMIILFLYKTDKNCVHGMRQKMFASEGPLIGFPPSIGAFLLKNFWQHKQTGPCQLSCRPPCNTRHEIVV
jgi:hypothetical protein